jgi:prephenate dehydrogenase
VSGVDRVYERAQLARRLGAIDTCVATVDQLGRPDLAIIATPPDQVVDTARRLLEQGARVVTDVGSVKAGIVDSLVHPGFVAGHPMAGSEGSGPASARPDMFVGAKWVLSPTSRTFPHALAEVRRLVHMMGAIPVVLDARTHDEAAAAISHVPHMAAAAVAALVGRHPDGDAILELAGGGFRDVTRIAKGDPGMWTAIAIDNPYLAGQLRDLGEMICGVAGAIADRDRDRLRSFLESGRVVATKVAARALPHEPTVLPSTNGRAPVGADGEAESGLARAMATSMPSMR